MDVELIVFLKGADLVASTAFLALTGKLGLEGVVSALDRADYYRFQIEGVSGGLETEARALEEALCLESTFFNRNKHHYSLVCRWGEGVVRRGVDRYWRRKALQIERKERGGEKTSGQQGDGRVNFSADKVFFAEVLVEEKDSDFSQRLGGRLESLLGRGRVFFGRVGILWSLVFRAEDEEGAGEFVEEVTVTRDRKHGLLINPHYQKYELLELKRIR